MKVTNLPFEKEKFESFKERACNAAPALKEALAECYCINVYEYTTADNCVFCCKNGNGVEYNMTIEVPKAKTE